MSDDQSAKTPSATSPTADAAPAPQRKPKTSKLGRIVIGLLLLVLAVEAAAHIRMTLAKSKLNGELARAEAEHYIVTRDAVKKLLGGREPDVSIPITVAVGEELYDIYYYKGLLKSRVLCVHYGIQGEKDADESEREMMEVLTVVPEVVLFKDGSLG